MDNKEAGLPNLMHYRLKFLAAFALLILSGLLFSRSIIGERKFHQIAYRNCEDGNWSRCIAYYKVAVWVDPGESNNYFNRAIAYTKVGNLPAAVEDYTKSLALRRDRKALLNRGAVYADLGQNDKAVEDYTQALRLDAGYILARMNRGRAYYEMGDYARAIEDYAFAHERNPKDAAALRSRGSAYELAGNEEAATRDYLDACRLGDALACNAFSIPSTNPSRPHAASLLEEHRRAEALRNLDRVAETAPERAPNYDSGPKLAAWAATTGFLPAGAPAQAAETAISTAGPTLLWEKTFKDEITSVAMSKDGQRIAVSDRGGYFRYLDAAGKELWQFEYKRPKEEALRSSTDGVRGFDSYSISDVAMSDDGTRIACTLHQLFKWRQDVTELPSWRTHEDEVGGYFPGKILYLDSAGKLLWEFKAVGYPRISPDGKHVLIEPMLAEGSDGWPLDKFYFLGGDGKLLWTEPGMEFPRSGISDDGRHVYTKAAVFRKDHGVVWKPEKEEFIRRVGAGVIVTEKFFETGDKKASAKLRVHDLENHKLLWEKEIDATVSPSDEKKAARGLMVSEKYVVATEYQRVWIFDKKSGQVLRDWTLSGRECLCSCPISTTADENYLLITACEGLKFYGIDGKSKWSMNFSITHGHALSESGKLLVMASKKNLSLFDNSRFLQ